MFLYSIGQKIGGLLNGISKASCYVILFTRLACSCGSLDLASWSCAAMMWSKAGRERSWCSNYYFSQAATFLSRPLGSVLATPAAKNHTDTENPLNFTASTISGTNFVPWTMTPMYACSWLRGAHLINGWHKFTPLFVAVSGTILD